MPAPHQRRAPISEAHGRLGQALRSARERAGVNTRQVPKEGARFYSSGHISLVEAGATAASPELISAYVNIGGDRTELLALHEQALAATRDAGRARRQGPGTAPPRPPRDASVVRDRREVQQHYLVVAQDVEFAFAPSGAITEAFCSVRIRAKVAGVRLYHAGFAYPTDQRPGVLTVEPVRGGSVAEVRESPTGAVAAYFLLDRDVDDRDAQPYDLAYRIRVHSDVPAAPRLRYFAEAGNEQLTLSIAPPSPSIFETVWWFAAPDVVDAEHGYPDRRLTPQPTGHYRRTFDRLIPGWCYGFAWTPRMG